MTKYFLAFILLASPCFAGIGIGGFPFPGPGCKPGSTSPTCSTTPYISDATGGSGVGIGRDATAAGYAAGLLNTSTTALQMCSVELYLRENGSLAGKTLYVEKWSTSTYNLATKLQDVVSVDATLLPNPIGWYKINFSSEISLAQNEMLVFTLNEVTGETNYVTLSVKLGGSVIPDQVLIGLTSAGLGLYSSGASDFMVKIYKNE